MEANLEVGCLDKQKFVSCEELTQDQDDKLTANATFSGWPTQQQCHQQVVGHCWMTMQLIKCHHH
jgi:hypothetical protein